MKLFIDSAKVEEIKKAWEWGIIDGVTTNPSLAAKANKPYSEIIKEIFSVVDGPVSLEVLATDYEGMLSQSRALAKINKNVVVKIPCTQVGLKALQTLKSENIKTNVTLVFSLSQALLVGKLGSDYCSPFVGRLNDISDSSGEQLILDIRQVYDNFGFNTKILAASIRELENLENMALLAADICTLPMKVLESIVKHPLTDKGLKTFLDDWDKSGLKLPV